MLGLGIVLASISIWIFGLRWVATPSVPTGLWWVHPGTAQRGTYVAVCLPHAVTQRATDIITLLPGSCSDGTSPVMKHLAAMQGDVVTVSTSGVRINRVLYPQSTRIERNEAGIPIPTSLRNGTYWLESNTIWLMGDSPQSWDSRYYGPIPTNSIIGIGTPLLTKRAHS